MVKWLNKSKFHLRYVDDILAPFEKEQDSLKFLNILNNKHPNIKFTLEKQVNHSITSLDVFISGIDNQNFTLKNITNRPIRDKSFKICNNWNSFHKVIEALNLTLLKMHRHI